jgi:hypothetical protein
MAERTGFNRHTLCRDQGLSLLAYYKSLLAYYKVNGGADGIRTRDPRRDRPVF